MHDLARRRPRDPVPRVDAPRDHAHPLALGFLQHGVIEATPGGTEQPRRDPESVEGMRRLPDLIGDPLPGEIGQRRIDRVIPRVIADPHARALNHPNDARVSLDQGTPP